MATTKNAQLRYHVLDKCFRNPGKKYFWQDLLEEINKALVEYNGSESGIQRRQLLDDIKFMESEAGWSVELDRKKDGRKVYYRYVDLSFSINNQPLNETELNQLQSAMTILSKFKGLPQFEWMEELIPKLQKGLAPVEINPVLQFEENAYLKGKEWISTIFNAILYKNVIDVKYQHFKTDEIQNLTLHPYLLKQYNNRWFVFGFNPAKKIYSWTLALDRIKGIAEKNEIYIENTEINWEEYFDDFVGITKTHGESLIKIQLWFHPNTAPYIKTKPFHSSQKKISEDETGLIVQIEVIPNYELYQQLLFQGDKVKVLSPDTIQNIMKEKLENARRLY